MIKSINPSTGKLIQKYNTYSQEELTSIITEVSDEYGNWRKASFEDRKKVLLDIANSLNENLIKHATMKKALLDRSDGTSIFLAISSFFPIMEICLHLFSSLISIFAPKESNIISV